MTAPSDPTALVAELDREVEREAERIAESVLRRAPIFLEKVADDFYEMLLREVQTYLRENAASNIQSELSSLRASLQAERERSAQQAATIEAVTKERDEARLVLGQARLCVNCGQVVNVEDISEVGDCSACQGPDGLSACTFDVTPAKAFEIWRDRYYSQRAALTAAEAERDRLREALKVIAEYPRKGQPRRTSDGYPAEIAYDEYAYKRIVDTYRVRARAALSTAKERGE